MGTVYLARDQRLGRLVAIKFLDAANLSSRDRRQRFFHEARAAAAIRHPNVATIHEVGETPAGEPYIVMEYCEGETLAQRLRRSPLTTAEFFSIARQIAAGLAAAHENGVIHRDIKSPNIILETGGTLKILDFGLARLLPREDPVEEKPSYESTSGHFFGTLHYLSPEQARGLPADERSDLFSVGVVFYQMASGQLPFHGESPLLVLERIRDAEPEPFTPADPAFPPAASRMIGRLLQKDPGDRYPSARALLHDLDEIETPTARYSTQHLPGGRSSIGRTRHRSPWVRLTVAAAAIVAVVTGIVFARRSATATKSSPVVAAPPQPIRSLAVLPLKNLANNTSEDFLSVGVADALVTDLQQIASLQVRPTSAVLPYKGSDPKRAAEKLQVDGILEGHFLAAGDLVRVNLQLIDTRTGYGVWADSVDGNRSNLLALIDAVSDRTVTALNRKLGMQEAPRTASHARSSNPRAYEEYLRARATAGSLQPEEFRAHLASLRRAIALDPQFAAAYADLAVALSLGHTRGLATEGDTIARAEWYARQAVRLDPNLPEAHLALARVFVRFPDRYREAVRENLAALRLNPNLPQALWVLTTYFISAGDTDKAACVTDRLVRIDPSSNEAKTRGYLWINSVDPDGALREAEHALASDDTALAGHDVRAVAFILRGDLAQAEREADAVQRLVPDHYLGKSLRAMLAAARGDRAAAEEAIRSFEPDARRQHWAAIRVAQVYARLGDRDRAVEWVSHAARLGHHAWYSLVKHPWFADLQTDPDFQQIVTRIKSDLDDVRDDVTGVYELICR